MLHKVKNMKKLSLIIFKIIFFIIKTVYPKITIEGMENLPDDACIIAANHTQMNGPICCEIYPPRQRYTWCAGEMMHLKDVPKYAFSDFWSQKPKYTHAFYKLLSYIIAPLSVCVFNNAKTIAVYRDKRIITTFKESIKKLNSGLDIIIFPEQDVKHNNIVYKFQEGFVDIAKIYYKRYGKELSFVPMYIAPRLKKMYIGKPVVFDGKADIAKERERISLYLMDEITDIATKLPEHIVIPYRNIPKKDYPLNRYDKGAKQ